METIREGRRGTVGLVGLAAIGAYVLGAWISGSISPLARRPVLDGAATLPYRWVAPPPSLAGTNKPPYSTRSTVAFSGDGSQPDVINTNDQQAEVLLQPGAIPKVPGADSVTVTIVPIDPATIGSPPDHLFVLGNAYRFRAAYAPTGAAVSTFRTPPQIFLMWPAVGVAARDRTLLSSPDGASWTALRTQVDHSLLTATAEPASMNGYFEVATTGHPSVPTSSATGSIAPPGGGGAGGSSSGSAESVVPWLLVGAAVVVVAVLVAVRVRARARESEYQSYQQYREDGAPTTPAATPDAPPPPPGEPGKGAHRRRRGP